MRIMSLSIVKLDYCIRWLSTLFLEICWGLKSIILEEEYKTWERAVFIKEKVE